MCSRGLIWLRYRSYEARIPSSNLGGNIMIHFYLLYDFPVSYKHYLYYVINMQLKFIKRIKTTKNSIFYSIVPYTENTLIGVGRRKYDENERLLKFIHLNNEFEVIEDKDSFLIIGEDPRLFMHNNNLYVQDNYWNDMHIINLTKFSRIKIDISGKNISFISHNGRLYFIHYMCPFMLYEFCEETGKVFQIDVYQDYEENFEYRGGTAGYKLKDNVYYGFGHRTYTNKNGIIKHDIFYWQVNFEWDKPYIEIITIIQPPNSLNICDPTSIVQINDKKYLITAESEYPWFQEQDYVTNVYEIMK